MKKSSFIVISFFLSVLALVTTVLPPSDHQAIASAVTPSSGTMAQEPSSAIATSSPVVAVLPPAPARAPARPLIAPKQQEVSAAAVIDRTAASGPPTTPARLAIPAIGLNSRIIAVSTNARGEMSVPDGSTNNVGWFAGGVVPGNAGTAVMDAHVFAAFANLHKLAKGDDIYVTDANGNRLHFIVRAAETYALTDLTSDMLFQKTDGRHLNLITCAGSLTPDNTTYDHRLIVYAELAD